MRRTTTWLGLAALAVECMRQSFLSVTFPPLKGGGYVTVKYPVEFSPDDPDQ